MDYDGLLFFIIVIGFSFSQDKDVTVEDVWGPIDLDWFVLGLSDFDWFWLISLIEGQRCDWRITLWGLIDWLILLMLIGLINFDWLQDKDVNGAVLREVVNHCKLSKLEKFEIPGQALNGDQDEINSLRIVFSLLWGMDQMVMGKYPIMECTVGKWSNGCRKLLSMWGDFFIFFLILYKYMYEHDVFSFCIYYCIFHQH